ncbi:hypothetical protein AML01_24195 [Escherichia coli]|nr:hypothetical protein AML01_24195 [Escherichia coli]
MRLAGQVLITLITWRSHVSGFDSVKFAATDQAVHHCRTIARHLKVRSRQQEGIILSRHFSRGPVR